MYVAAESVDLWGTEPESEGEPQLLEKLVLIAHANPYWLFDPDCTAGEAEVEVSKSQETMDDGPSVYAPLDIILKWIKEGKPHETTWLDGQSS